MSESRPAGCLKAVAGLILVFVVHVPRLISEALRLSYALVFHNEPNLTASPVEHLRRAKRLLRRRKNSEILYAALELRFAVERMAQNEIFWEKVPNRVRKNPDPVKKLKALHRADPRTTRRLALACFPYALSRFGCLGLTMTNGSAAARTLR